MKPRDRVVEASCSVDPPWATFDATQSDCFATVDKFYDIEVKPLLLEKREHEDFEFHSEKLPGGGTGHPDRIMPRKYTVR